ncbi:MULTISPECIES: tyrosinase family protein [Streptomyces violaceusniger group]|uniref:tyrosinase family protein n=1 Tax=Streptomyces violaceusniger group TaxID=2839105 RepID=UPI000A3BF7A8|nr:MULTISPECIES: tyrosinase family protein [Streptomyces violaceusniger group]
MTPYVRKNHSALGDEERQLLLDAIVELNTTPSAAPHPGNTNGTVYGDFVATHVDAMVIGPGHGSPIFLPWHRQYLIEFEQALNRTETARGKPRIALAYWDWTTDREENASPWTDAWLGENSSGLLGQVQRSRFGVPDAELAKVLSESTLSLLRAAGGIKKVTWEEQEAVWREVVQNLAERPDSLAGRWVIDRTVDSRAFLIRDFDRPLSETLPFGRRETDAEKQARRKYEGEFYRDYGIGLMDMLDLSVYDVFAQRFEDDQHGAVHAELGGALGGMASPNDPAFWFLHSFVDKVWADWQAKQRREHPDAAPYLPVQGTGDILGYRDLFGPWKTMTAEKLINTAEIRHPQYGLISYTYG